MRTVGRFMIATALLLAAIGAEQIGTDTTSRAWAAQTETPSDRVAPGAVARRNDQPGSVDDRDAGDLSTVLEMDSSPNEEFVHVYTAPADPEVENTAATGTKLRVSFSKGAAYQVAVPSQGTCASVDAVVTCDLGSILNRDVATIA